LGAAIGVSHNEEKVKKFHSTYVNEARGSWSATPTVSIELLNHFSKEENRQQFLKGLSHITDLVKERSSSFISQANEIGLKTHPFRSGFYTVILTKNPDTDYLKLAEHRIFAVPMSGGIRLALCSLSKKEIIGLPKRIKSILNL
jgi:aspartate/tyrosine/aromatic aminotransferase